MSLIVAVCSAHGKALIHCFIAQCVGADPRRAGHSVAVVPPAAGCPPGQAAIQPEAVPCWEDPVAVCSVVVPAGVAVAAAGTPAIPSYSSSIDSSSTADRENGQRGTSRPKPGDQWECAVRPCAHRAALPAVRANAFTHRLCRMRGELSAEAKCMRVGRTTASLVFKRFPRCPCSRICF
jgi:hypothetical protein